MVSNQIISMERDRVIYFPTEQKGNTYVASEAVPPLITSSRRNSICYFLLDPEDSAAAASQAVMPEDVASTPKSIQPEATQRSVPTTVSYTGINTHAPTEHCSSQFKEKFQDLLRKKTLTCNSQP